MNTLREVSQDWGMGERKRGIGVDAASEYVDLDGVLIVDVSLDSFWDGFAIGLKPTLMHYKE